MAKLFKPKIVTYTMPGGSYRTPEGKRVTSKTPGALRTVTEGEKWYGRLQDGTRVPLFESKELSKIRLNELRHEHDTAKLVPEHLKKAQAVQATLDRPLGQYVEEYRQSLMNKNNTADYLDRTVSHINASLTACEFKTVGDIDREKLLGWLAKRRAEDDRTSRHGFGISTSNHYITAMKGFSRWLVSKALKNAVSDPLFGMEKLNADADLRIERRTLTDKDFLAVLDTAKKGPTSGGLTGAERYVLYTLAAYTGLRAAELASLTPASFRLDGEMATVRVQGEYTKNKKTATLPLHASAVAMLRDFIRGKEKDMPLWPGKAEAPHESWYKHGALMLRGDLEAAGLEYIDDTGRVFDFHALRGQFITALARAGVELQLAQKLARHSTPVLTANIYTRLRIDDQAAAIDKLPALHQPVPKQGTAVS